MEAVIGKWGNSLAVRLPAAALKEAGYQVEQKVNLVVSAGRIVIEPAVSYDLDKLLCGITADNAHAEANFGPTVGQEPL